MTDTCPNCGAEIETARHYRGHGSYYVEQYCAACGHFDFDIEDGDQ